MSIIQKIQPITQAQAIRGGFEPVTMDMRLDSKGEMDFLEMVASDLTEAKADWCLVIPSRRRKDKTTGEWVVTVKENCREIWRIMPPDMLDCEGRSRPRDASGRFMPLIMGKNRPKRIRKIKEQREH